MKKPTREPLPVPLFPALVTFVRAEPIGDDFWRKPVHFEKVTLTFHETDPKEPR